MSDEFDRRDWAEDLNEGIRNRDTWLRGLKIIVLFLFVAAARFVLIITTFYQFCFCLVRNRPSEFVKPIGPWLARYVEKVILFITWNSDHAPFPFTHFNRVMGEEPEYRYDESAFHAEEETYAEENEQYSPAPPPAEEADEDHKIEEDTGEESPEDDKSQPNEPPRPDA